MTRRQIVILLAHALVGYVLCGSIIWIGFSIWTVETTLIVHAIGVPIIFLALSWIYFNLFNHATTIQTALTFTLSAILLDFFIVAMVINKSFEMFTSPIGTWIPFMSIFLTTYLVGTYLNRKKVPT